MVTHEFPWQPDENTSMQVIACMNFGGDLRLYSSGFREGAEVLLKVLHKKRHLQDFLVYPFVYSVRHSVELALKQVIQASRRLIGEPGDFPDSHNLHDLWSTCQPILKQVWPGDDPSYRQVAATVEALCAIDPEGEAFRYPVSTKKRGVRNATLDPNLRNLDLQKLFDDSTTTLDLLDGADTGIDVYLQAKADMVDEYRQMEDEMRGEYESEIRSQYRDEW